MPSTVGMVTPGHPPRVRGAQQDQVGAAGKLLEQHAWAGRSSRTGKSGSRLAGLLYTASSFTFSEESGALLRWLSEVVVWNQTLE